MRSFVKKGLLSILVICFASAGLTAQEGNLLAVGDTSYFKQGQDEWNLIESVKLNEPGNVHLLLNRNVNPDAKSNDDITALMHAADSTRILIMRLLLVNGADPNLSFIENTTPIILAVLNNQFDAAEILLQKGADPDLKDDYEASALLYAAALNYFQLIDLLLYYGADKQIRDKDGNDALMTAVFFEKLEATDVLLQNGFDPETTDKKGNTALMVAAQQGNFELVQLLLDYRASVNAVNNKNYTALAFAIRYQHARTVNLLIDSGADVNHAVTPNRNLLEIAKQMKDQEIVKALKAKGAKRSVKPDFSEVSLSWGNSFSNHEYMMQVRGAWIDKRYGFYAETGIDWRPAPFKVQIRENDTLIYQYRENRIGWNHGIGKKLTYKPDNSNMEIGIYGCISGFLSFPRHSGLKNNPPVQYNIIPAGGIYVGWRYAGFKMGFERYYFKTIYEQKWKFNLTLFIRISYNNTKMDYKEIYY